MNLIIDKMYNLILKIFYWIGGVHNYNILSKMDDNSINKAWRNSISVIVASFLAFIGMFLTLSIVINLNNLTYSIIGSIIWASIIFLIDRTIITNKSKNNWNVLIRIIIVILTSLVVMTSIELVIFNSAIEEKMLESKITKNNDLETQVNNDKLVMYWKSKIDSYEKEKLNLIDEIKKQSKALRLENFGQSNSNMVGYGAIAKSIQRDIDRMNTNLEYINNKIDEYTLKIEEKTNKIISENEKINSSTSISNRIDKRIDALYNLQGFILNLSKWFIAILLMLIELTPVINKLTDKTDSKYETFFDDVTKIKILQEKIANIQ